MSPQTVIEKIQKLLALATSSNEHEAGAAMDKAQQLLAEHNLSMESLGSAGEVETVGECPNPLDKGKRLDSWKTQLGMVVADHTGVKVFIRSMVGGQKTLVLVGTPTDCEGARAMFHWLSIQLVRLSYHDCAGQGRSYKSQWLNGAVQGIRKQFEDIRRAEQHQAPGAPRTAGLVTLDHARAAEQWVKVHLNLKTTSSRFNVKDGYHAGAAAGGSMSLRPSGAIGGRAALGCK